MENDKDYEEIQLSNIWIKTHILDVIEELNQLQTIAKIGSLDIVSLSQIDENEKSKTRLNALDLFEAKIEVLKGNVFFGISASRKLKIILLLKAQSQIKNICKYNREDGLNFEEYRLNENFHKKLELLQKIKEQLIDACAEKGLLLPKVDETLEEKTEVILEGEDNDG